jgi:hypothetical protein
MTYSGSFYLWLLIWIGIGGGVGGLIGKSKGRGGLGFFLGLILGVIGWIIIAVMSPAPGRRPPFGYVGAAQQPPFAGYGAPQQPVFGAPVAAAPQAYAAPSGADGLHRECPHCKEQMRRDADVCPHCRMNSEPWSFRDGRWWVSRPSGSYYLDPGTQQWVQAQSPGPSGPPPPPPG